MVPGSCHGYGVRSLAVSTAIIWKGLWTVSYHRETHGPQFPGDLQLDLSAVCSISDLVVASPPPCGF